MNRLQLGILVVFLVLGVVITAQIHFDPGNFGGGLV